MTEATRVVLSKLAKASSLRGLPTAAGEPLHVCAYSDAKQRLYFFGEDAKQPQADAEVLHHVTLSDLEQGVGTVRIGGAAGEAPQDRFYGGTRVASMVFNGTGDRLLLCGPAGEAAPYLGVVDLRNEGGSAAAGGGKRAPHHRLLSGEVHGRLLKAAWHPLSKTHVVALLGPAQGAASGLPGELHVYDVAAQEENGRREPEQRVFVDGDVTSFCFGPESLWQRFTIYLVGAGSQAMGIQPRLLALCPVIPYRAQVPAVAVKELQEAVLEELALDKVARRREELEAQWTLLSRCFGDVTELAKERGDDFLAFRWVTNRAALGGDGDRKPALQEVEYPTPPQGTSVPRALDLVNPSGTLPALAVTYDKEVVDVLLMVSLVEPVLETGDEDAALHRWRPMEARRLARLKVGHRTGEALPQLLLDPERHVHGTLYLVRDHSVLRVVLPWVRRLEELGEQDRELGSRPPGKTRMREVYRFRGSDGGKKGMSVGACMVYNASLGSLLVVRRRDAEVETLNLAILPFMVDEEGEDGEEDGFLGSTSSSLSGTNATRKQQLDTRFSNFVPFETACKADLQRLREGHEGLLRASPPPSGDQIVRLKQEIIARVIIPLRALQTRMVVRGDEVAVLYERAHAAAKALDARLEGQRVAYGQLQERMEAAEKQLEQDESMARVAADHLQWVRAVITPQENRKFQEVQLAEARLKNLDQKLHSVEQWVQAKASAGAGEAAVAAGAGTGARDREHEEARRRLVREVEELAKDVALLESAVCLDEEDALEERRGGGGGGQLLLNELDSLRIN